MSEPIRTEIPEIQMESAPEKAYPMAWHGFLTKCLLWLLSAAHILQAYWIFSGKVYYTAEIRAQIYAGIPAMRLMDYALIACLLIAAILQLIARRKLIKMEWPGVKKLLAAYAVLAAGHLIYALARLIFAGLSPLNIPVVAQVLAYGSLLLVNRSYYLRRRSAFGKETK